MKFLKRKKPEIVDISTKSRLFLLVAEAETNLRPPGSSHKASPCLLGALRSSPCFFTSAPHLFPPPAAVRRFAPTSYARRSHNPCISKKKTCLFRQVFGCGGRNEPAASGFFSQGFALLAPQKHSRPARLVRFAVLLVSSPQRLTCFRHRRRCGASPQRATLVVLITLV